MSACGSDIEPRAEGIAEIDVFDLEDTRGADVFITNPPWDRKILHPLSIIYQIWHPLGYYLMQIGCTHDRAVNI